MPRPPFRVLPRRGEPLALRDAPATRALEAAAAALLPPHALMRRAGASVARLALALAPHAGRIWIAAGPGNNGGDAMEAALGLKQAGKEVEVSFVGDTEALPADAAAALVRVRDAGIALGTRPGPAAPAGLAIDGLLGLGARRAPEGAIAAAIRALGACGAPLLAIDLPSGLDARTGRPLGEDCVRADHTLALLALKPGLLTGAGRDFAGTLWLDDLGVAPEAGAGPPTAWLSGVDPHGRLPRRHASNKGGYGDVAIVGGAPGMVGAALLAARAAQASGAGRVFVEWLDRSAALARLDIVRPELMFRDGWTEAAGDALGRATVVCGCGGGVAVAAPLRTLLEAAGRLVVDADALNAIAADGALAAALRARAARGQATVLTPHPLEAARLLGVAVAAVEGDRLAAAAELASRFACTVVLKGSGSVIAAPGRVPHVNATGNAALATAGSGDVLAGWLGGLWAQRAPGTADDAARGAFDGACRAVAEHGAAAEDDRDGDAPRAPLRASDLIERLHARSERGA